MADLVWSDVSDVIDRPPGLVPMASVPELVQNAILAYVNDALSANYFGGEESITYKLARVYLAAHIATVTETNAVPAGPLTGEIEGGLQRTYAVIQNLTNNVHGSTSYGRLYDDLVRSSPGRGGLHT